MSKVYTLLESGPDVLVATAYKGRANFMPLSWLTMIDFEPPVVGLLMSDRNYSFAALKATRECTINVPDAKNLKTIHHLGGDRFMVAGKTIRLRSKAK